MIKLLHFSDAHIDIVSQGKHDPESGLPLRVLDFLKALDAIIAAAIKEKADLVIFSGDAYKDRNPSPTYVREWGRRIMRLSQAGIHTLLLVGNHDISPAAGRANTLHDFDTLQVPNVRVISQPEFLRPGDLWNLPVQVIGLPYITRSGMAASGLAAGNDPNQLYSEIEVRVRELVNSWLDARDPALPVIMTAHASIQGAVYGQERSVILGNDLTYPGSLVKDSRLDYVAMGHIHKGQDINEGNHPPVVYAGSIERVDFGEMQDEKYYVLANVDVGKTAYALKTLQGRRFMDKNVDFTSEKQMLSADEFMKQVYAVLPDKKELDGIVLRLTIEYPRDWESLLDETGIREYCESAFELHLRKHPHTEARLRLPADASTSSMLPVELLQLYLDSRHFGKEDATELIKTAKEIFSQTESSRAEQA